MIEEFSRVEKSTTIERYNLYFKPYGYAYITIDPKDGFFSAVTDWGDYSYIWSSPGENFKRFLTRLDSGYLLGKFRGGGDYFDQEYVVKGLKREICRARKDSVIDKDEAREAYTIISEEEDWDSSNAFWLRIHREFEDHDLNFAKIFGEDPEGLPSGRGYHPRDTWFVEKIFPLFQKILKEEIDAKRSPE